MHRLATDAGFAHIGQDFVARLSQPGPRYTSYPTAPEWQEEQVDGGWMVEKLAAISAQKNPAPVSLYLHIPFCKEICFFCGCNTFKSTDKKHSRAYLDYLLRELDLYAEHLKTRRQAVQIHWGGGTPTFLEPQSMRRLHEKTRELFAIANDAEVAIELDPRETTHEQIDLLKELGFNRISLGVQDFNPEVQVAANRIQPQALTTDFYQYCRKQGFESINFDLIYGLPKQTLESFLTTVTEVIALKPDRVAMFSYAHVPWLKPFQRKINEADLPESNVKFQSFVMARKKFLEAGYRQIGLDHFALPEDELSLAQQEGRVRRNFQGYTVKPESYVYAAGITAISDLGDLYLQNQKKFNLYYDRIDAKTFATFRGCRLSHDDQLRRFVITQLMCNFRLDFKVVEDRFKISFSKYFANELKQLEAMEISAKGQQDSFFELGSAGMQIRPLGQIFIRNLCMVFDAYLQNRQAGPRLFSKTI